MSRPLWFRSFDTFLASNMPSTAFVRSGDLQVAIWQP